MDLTVIIVSWKVKDLLKDCLYSLEQEKKHCNFKTVVIDNHSCDGTVELIKNSFPSVKLIALEKNIGFAAGNNLALKKLDTDYALLLNPDTYVKDKAIMHLLDFIKQDKKIGAVGPQLLNPNETIQPSCHSFPTVKSIIINSLFLDIIFAKSKFFGNYQLGFWDHKSKREVDQPMGAALMISKDALDTIGGTMDEDFYMFFDEVDLCFRIKKANYKIFFLPKAKIVHYGGQSIKKAEIKMSYHWRKSLKKFFKKHYHLSEFKINTLFFLCAMLRFLIIAFILTSLIFIGYYFLKN